MMKKQKIESIGISRSAKGFSLIEILAIVAIVGVVCGLGAMTTTRLRETTTDRKLKNDIAALNQAVAVYQANGGSLEGKTTGTEVLAALKTKTCAVGDRQLVGVHGPFIDLRLRGVAAEEAAQPRAVWNSAKKRFEEHNAGEGFAAFDLGGALDEPAEETRETVQRFASMGGWVWDHAPAAAAEGPAPPKDEGMTLASHDAYAPAEALNPEQLRAPRIVPNFEINDGLYGFTGSNTFTLENPNTAENSSQIYYSLNDGPWTLYQGEPIPLQALWDNNVRAYAAATDSDLYYDSALASNVFKTVFFAGTSDGYYTNPQGPDTAKEHSILSGGGQRSKHFEWGQAAIELGANTLDFSQNTSFNVVPNQEFLIGKVSYTNSTTYVGTTAESIDVEVEINFSVPENVTEKLRFTLRLESTTNTDNREESMDSVYLPVLSSEFEHVFQGKTFYLNLRFETHDPNGSSTPERFHVYETSSAEANLFGTLSTQRR